MVFKIRILVCFLICTNCMTFFAQDMSDALRLKDLKYMEFADRTDCPNTAGSTLEDRICLNLEFQFVDSIMNAKLGKLLKSIDGDTIARTITTYQEAWVNHRRMKSKIVSSGYRGHMLGIIYLSCMVETTKQRIEELNYVTKKIANR